MLNRKISSLMPKTLYAPNNNSNNTVESEADVLVGGDEEAGEVLPSEQEGENETFRTVPEEEPVEEVAANNEANALPNECYPKDVLTPQDLLPQDANSTWAQTVPSGQGSPWRSKLLKCWIPRRY